MDTLLLQGDHHTSPQGLPITITGNAALLQQAMFRLQIPQGSFVYDVSLGSQLYLLQGQGDSVNRAALSYAQEALAGLAEITVDRALCREELPGQLAITLWLTLDNKTYTMEVIPT